MKWIELKQKHPGECDLFEQYLNRQKEENEILEKHAVCVTLLLKSV
jgi:hypothetical protein